MFRVCFYYSIRIICGANERMVNPQEFQLDLARRISCDDNVVVDFLLSCTEIGRRRNRRVDRQRQRYRCGDSRRNRVS